MKSSLIDQSLMIKTPSKKYPIYWFKDFPSLIEHTHSLLKEKPSYLFVSSQVYSLYKSLFKKMFPSTPFYLAQDGEVYKNLRTMEEMVRFLLKNQADRRSLIFIAGGGVLGDTASFTASIYMRGVPYISIPTTLLAMVDSSVGGKTGVNFQDAKNLLGTFYHPQEVLIALPFLHTLPQREYLAGLAEVIKHALIKDKKSFFFLKERKKEILEKDIDTLLVLTHESVKVKKSIVEKDEKETLLRGVLNFGHTLGHAIEAFLGYKKLLHGEAISIGMHFASYYSYKKGYLSKEKYEEIKNLLIEYSLPISYPLDKEKILNIMEKDKKKRKKEWYFVFLEKIGKVRLPEKVDKKELSSVLEEFLKIPS